MESASEMTDRWPNQQRAFDGTIDAINRGVKRLCVTSPTGSGKTRMFTDMIEWAVENKRPVALYTQRRMLYDQTCRVLEKAGVRFGKRASGHSQNLFLDVQMCMSQTELSRVYKQESRGLHKAAIVLIDELHQHCGPTFKRIVDDHVSAGATVIGYTATPLDIDGYDELLVAGTMSECLRIGALVRPETYAPDEPDLRHIRNYVVGKELTESQNVKSIMRPGVFARVFEAWKKHNPDGRPTLLFGPDVAGSLFFAQEFWKNGISAAHIDGEQIWINGEFFPTDDDHRIDLDKKSQAGEVKVVCNRFVLREGIDWPWIEVGCFATVFGALTSFLQSGGRLLRAHPGKTKCVILDHGGNYHRHGSLAVDRNWALGMTNQRVTAERAERLREKKESEPITCPQCAKVRASGPTCPACGFTAHKRSRLVIQVDGTLKQVVGESYKPHRERMAPDTQKKWEIMYYRARSDKWNATFRQAAAMFFRENYYWPPKTLRLMPRDSGDWWRRVKDVPRENLIQ
jgi:superfamily II DNA or RNA helicase